MHELTATTHCCHYTTPFGMIGIEFINDTITHIELRSNKDKTAALPSTIKHALDNYFAQPSKKIRLPTQLVGTDFQQKVWRTLQTIPAGTAITYGELAEKLNSHPRAIGQACRRNPIPLIYPCHRVIGKDHLGGFYGEQQGELPATKHWLLRFEGFL